MHNPHKFILPPFFRHTQTFQRLHHSFPILNIHPSPPTFLLSLEIYPQEECIINRNLHCLTPVTNTAVHSSTTPRGPHRLFSKQHHHDPNTWHLLHVCQFVSHGSNNKYPAFQFHHRRDTDSQLLSGSQDRDQAARCPSPPQHTRNRAHAARDSQEPLSTLSASTRQTKLHAVRTCMPFCPHTISYYTRRSRTLSLTTLATKENKLRTLQQPATTAPVSCT